MMKIIFEETTTIGLRFYEAQRRTLNREIKSLNTKFGKVNIKISKLGGKVVRKTPEYEGLQKTLKKLNMPLIEVMKKISSQS